MADSEKSNTIDSGSPTGTIDSGSPTDTPNAVKEGYLEDALEQASE